jgi:hypothetical protein
VPTASGIKPPGLTERLTRIYPLSFSFEEGSSKPDKGIGKPAVAGYTRCKKLENAKQAQAMINIFIQTIGKREV